MNDPVLERRERQGCVLDEFQGCHINVLTITGKYICGPGEVSSQAKCGPCAWSSVGDKHLTGLSLSVCLSRVSHGVGNLQDRRPNCWNNTGEQVIVETHCSAILVQE
jgi:hypothetical protein